MTRLEHFQALLEWMKIHDAALSAADDRQGVYIGLRATVEATRRLAQTTGLDDTDKPALYALAMELNALNSKAWRAFNAHPDTDGTRRDLWRTFRRCLSVAYCKAARAYVGVDGDITAAFINLA